MLNQVLITQDDVIVVLYEVAISYVANLEQALNNVRAQIILERHAPMGNTSLISLKVKEASLDNQLRTIKDKIDSIGGASCLPTTT